MRDYWDHPLHSHTCKRRVRRVVDRVRQCVTVTAVDRGRPRWMASVWTLMKYNDRFLILSHSPCSNAINGVRMPWMTFERQWEYYINLRLLTIGLLVYTVKCTTVMQKSKTKLTLTVALTLIDTVTVIFLRTFRGCIAIIKAGFMGGPVFFLFSDFLPVCWQEFDSKFILYRWKEGFLWLSGLKVCRYVPVAYGHFWEELETVPALLSRLKVCWYRTQWLLH